MLRNARHAKILEIIEDKEIETQEELCRELELNNFAVTQATVSRDIRELHLFKVAGIRKRYRYAAVNREEGDLTDKMRVLFQNSVETIAAVNNIIVIHTINGNGANAGVVIDRLNYKEVAGTVAGVDTVLTVCRTDEDAIAVKRRLESIANL